MSNLMELAIWNPKTPTEEMVMRVLNCFWAQPVTVGEIVTTSAAAIDELIKEEVARQLAEQAIENLKRR